MSIDELLDADASSIFKLQEQLSTHSTQHLTLRKAIMISLEKPCIDCHF